MFYSSLIPNLGLKAITEGFKKKYPFVAIESWRGTEVNIAQKTLAELRAGAPAGDLLEGSELAPIFIKSGFLQRFSSPEILKTPAQYRDKTGLTAATRFSYYGTAFNTKLVPPGTQPKSFAELLDPKWKNKMAWRVGSDSGTHMFVANLMLSTGEAKADAYLKSLAAQNVVGFTGSAQALIDRVIAGEYAITLTTAQHLPIIAASKGAPIAAQVLQPMPATVASIMIPRGTKHPYAAMLFVDYVLSAEGQTVLRAGAEAGLPVFGASEGLVRSGGLAAAVSTPAQLAQQARLLGQKLAGAGSAGPLVESATPAAVRVNVTVARGLGLRLPEERELAERLTVTR